MSQESLAILLEILEKVNVCLGHPDNSFVEIGVASKGMLKRKDGQCGSFVDEYAPVLLNGEMYPRTLRTSACELLVNSSKCEHCIWYRSYLRKLYARSL